MNQNTNRLEVLNSQIHKNLKIKEINSTNFQLENIIDLVPSEIERAAISYPIIVCKNANTGSFVLVALCGFEKGENLLITNDGINASYIPSYINCLGFSLQNLEDHNEPVIMIETDNQIFSDTVGLDLFDNIGEPTWRLKSVMQGFATLIDGVAEIKDFIGTALALGLLKSATLDVVFEDESKNELKGVYIIDKDKLDCLNSEALIELHDKKLLSKYYAMCFSIGHINRLIDLKNIKINKNMVDKSLWFKKPNMD